MRGKLAFTFGVVTLALFALSGVLLSIHNNDNEAYSKIVLAQQNYDSTTIAAQRGQITDRNGTILATNEAYYNLILDPAVILAQENYTQTTIDALVEIYGVDRQELTDLINDRAESHYVRYKRYLTEEEMKAFTDLQEKTNSVESSNKRIKGVWFETEFRRVYPYNSLACSLIGFANSDGSQGNYGIEQYYNDVLCGTDGRSYGYLNEDANLERVTRQAINGSTVVTTIDATIQNIVEKHIADFMQTTGAKETAVIVMDPDTAEVLALATSEVYDLNHPTDVSTYYTDSELEAMSDEELVTAYSKIWRNYCLSESIEPGSTAKVFTVATALEEGIFSQNQWFYCDGGEQLATGVYVGCHLRSGHGSVSTAQSLMYSCNDALMQMSYMIGAEIFTEYQEMFNFGMKTGIDLPGEERGLTVSAEDETRVTLATNAFGQNFNVTMVQMAAAYCSVINGGNYYTPHVVKQILDDDGNVIKSIDKTLVRKTVSEATSEFIRTALYETVESGTGTNAKVKGYTAAGKTGTAEKIPRGDGRYLISFAGFVPYDDPEVLVYVVVDEPNVEDQSTGGYATKLFRDILTDILPYMNISPTSETDVVPGPAWAVPEDYTPPVDENGQPIDTSSIQTGDPENPEDPNGTEGGTANTGPRTNPSTNEDVNGWSMGENAGAQNAGSEDPGAASP